MRNPSEETVPDWDSAPEWADRYIKSNHGGERYFGDGRFFLYEDGTKAEHGEPAEKGGFYIDYDQFTLIEMRPAPQRSSQPHYKDDKDGLDHIARFARDNSIEEFRAAMRFTIDKYRDRLGEKDARSKELGKIADYYGRWAEVELELEQS